MDETGRPFLGVEDVARRLGVSTRWVRTIPPSELPYVQYNTPKGVRRYKERDLVWYIDKRTVRQ